MIITTTVDVNVEDLINKIEDRSGLSDIRNLCEIRILWLRGYADGEAAGSWVFDGNTPAETVLRIQRGVEEGDPVYMDMLPEPRLGGEHADDPTWAQVLKDEVEWDIEDPNTDQRDDLHDAYCDGFGRGVNDEVMSYGK